MKKIIAVFLALMLLAAGALGEGGEAAAPVSAEEVRGEPAIGARLGFELLEALYTPGENRVISPASLAAALGMAAEGARGETLAEILSALDAQDAADISGAMPEEIKSANAAFAAPDVALREAYLSRLAEAYAAECFAIDADVVSKVNEWVKEHTDGLIERLLSDAPGADTGLILINAVAMDAKWVLPFDAANNATDVFYAPGGEVEVEMMHQTATFDYVERDGAQFIRLPYDGGSLEMWIALPGEGASMEELLARLAEGGLEELSAGAERTEVSLSLPKMDVTDENSLADALKALGVEAAFGDAADFSGISDTPLYIGEVLQKARVQLDEEGTRAAAATALIMKCMALQPEGEAVEMNVNRPFAFAIADGARGNVCFAGVIENPLP